MKHHETTILISSKVIAEFGPRISDILTRRHGNSVLPFTP
jgi:hypothetical protein